MRTIEYFKNPKDAIHILHMHPMAVLIMMDMLIYIAANGEQARVTSAIRTPHQDRMAKAQSSTHQGARAFDLHANSWNIKFVDEFVKHFTEKYRGYGATNPFGEERLIVMHGEGDNFHAHVQLSRHYTIPDAWLHL
jgi:hypothetical protein